METIGDFYKRRKAADEISRANIDWDIKKSRMASPDAFATAVGLRGEERLGQPQWVPLEAIQFYDAGPAGEVIPDTSITEFSNEFPCASSTQIGYLVDMANPNYGLNDLRFRVFARYVFLPTGDARDVPAFFLTVPSSFERLRFYHSTGFTKPGYWHLGEYLAEVLVDDRHYFHGRFVMA